MTYPASDLGRPLWDEATEVAGWSGLPPVEGRLKADVCVVGLGASGLAAVEAAAERGLSVIGVDAGRVGGAASGRNGGFLLGGTALHPHEMIDRFGLDQARAMYRATLDEVDRLASDLGPGVVRRTGSVRLAGPLGGDGDGDGGGDEAADLARHEEALGHMGIRVERWSGPLGQGLFLPDDAACNPAARALAIAGRLESEPRVRLFERSPVLGLTAGSVDCERGTVSAGAIVACVDGGLEWLVPSLRGRVRTARLRVVATDPVRPVADCPVYARWGWDYLQQDSDGRLVLGGGRDRAGGDWLDSPADALRPPDPSVDEHLVRLVSTLAGAPISHRWFGLAAFTDDRSPVCEMVDGVAVAGAYSGVGNLLGPITARTAVDLALA